ncbi:MAG TPA: hypothetical protein VFB38_02930 [Chthonomonadaceae bacterium]|nr:hypothetical protein [Chthonomonadaceae bacterium]
MPTNQTQSQYGPRCTGMNGTALLCSGIAALLIALVVLLSSCAALAQEAPAKAAGHNGFVLAVCFSPDSRFLASGGDDHTIKIWSPATGALVRTIPVGRLNEPRALCFQPGTDFLTFQDGIHLKLQDVATGKEVCAWEADPDFKHVGGVNSMQYSPDGRTLLCGWESGGWTLWQQEDIKLGAGAQPIMTWKAVRDVQTNGLCAVRFAPDVNRIAAAAEFGDVVQFWKAGTAEPTQTLTFPDEMCYGMDSSPSGHRLAVVFEKALVELDADTGKILHKITLSYGHAAASSPRTNALAVADGTTVKIFDVQRSHIEHVLSGHTQVIFALAYSPDGRWIASGSRDRTVRLWNAQTGALQFTLGTDAKVRPEQLQAPKD